jgi:hypothetical protein
MYVPVRTFHKLKDYIQFFGLYCVGPPLQELEAAAFHPSFFASGIGLVQQQTRRKAAKTANC